METLIAILVAIVVFAILAFGMKWLCDTFFANFRPAYWICGLILLIMLLIAFASVFSGGDPTGWHLPWRH